MLDSNTSSVATSDMAQYYTCSKAQLQVSRAQMAAGAAALLQSDANSTAMFAPGNQYMTAGLHALRPPGCQKNV